MKIASVTWTDGRPAYVEAVPGDGGKDWSWTRDIKLAKPLGDSWSRRFLADAKRCAWRGASLSEVAQ